MVFAEGAEQEKMVTELKKSVASLSSYMDMFTSRIQNQLDTGEVFLKTKTTDSTISFN